MERFENLKDDETNVFKKKKNKYHNTCVYSDTIYTFDIETSNLFYIENEWRTFDYSKSKDFYTDVVKIGIPYIWQFSIDDRVYYGREFMDFEKVLIQISNPDIRKIIYVHNLSWEFAYLVNIFEGKYTIDNMICRDIRKPISFYIPELNIEFRCSYMLTNMSLKNASKEFTDVHKLDSLDYDSKVRTPLSYLTQKELMYCEYDCICVYKIIEHFKKIYKNICLIPLTSTGEVRREFRNQVDFYYVRKMQNLVPSADTYIKLWSVFSGGYTHSNILNTGRKIKNVKSMDIASSYPYSMLCKLPSTEFLRCTNAEFNRDKNYAYIAYVRYYNLDSNYYTHYMQVSKCTGVHLVTDNGRVVSADYVELWLTSIDADIIEKNYSYSKREVVECYKSYLDYLDERIIKFILKLYKNKTTLKGVKGKEGVYKRDKSMLNSLY